MLFDYVVMALMGLGIGSSLFDWFDTRASQSAAEDDTPGDDLPTEAPTDGAGDTLTTVLIEDSAGSVTEVEVDTSISDGTVTLTGTDEADIITADPDAGLDFGISSGGGDDAINFGLGVDADGGAGADQLDLSVTQAAFDANAAAGDQALTTFVDLSDSEDALSIELDEGIEGFVHFVTVTETGPDQPSDTDDTLTREIGQTLHVMVTDSAEPPTEEQVLGGPDGSQLVTIDLGTRVETFDSADPDTPIAVEGTINTDPLIAINRDVATQTALGL